MTTAVQKPRGMTMSATETMQKLGPNQEKWLSALESGKWKQSFGFPFDGEAYTALGLASMLFGCEPTKVGDRQFVYRNDQPGIPDIVGNNGYAHPAVTGRLAMRCRSGMCGDWQHIGGHNSIGTAESVFTFKELAALIRANPSAVFTEPR